MSTNVFPGQNARGVVYLAHFSGRTKQNRQHYLGFSSDLERRYRQHRLGWGANETKKAIAEGLKLTVAQTWDGTPSLERRLKEWSRTGKKGFSCICPLCGGNHDLPPDLARDLGTPSMRVYRSELRST
jgi:predicted GIY-YIG superfamily endonuclease